MQQMGMKCNLYERGHYWKQSVREKSAWGAVCVAEGIMGSNFCDMVYYGEQCLRVGNIVRKQSVKKGGPRVKSVT